MASSDHAGFSGIVELGDSGTTVITRTSRLARDLCRRVAIHRATRGRLVAPTPGFLSYDEWLRSLWNRGHAGARLLGVSAEQLLWEQIIDQDARSRGDSVPGLLDLPNLARLAGEAWQRIQDWGSPPEEGAGFTPETLAFRRWAATFRERLAEQGWITGAQLGCWAAIALEKGELEAPLELFFAGFERSWPRLERLIAALREAGTSVSGEIPDQAAAGADLPLVTVRVYPTRLEELRGVARELRGHLESRPASQLGVIAADLSGYRDVLERVLSEELHPASATLEGIDGPRRFDLAGAPALSDYPLVAHALDLLGLRPAANDFAVTSRVLLAPYPRPADGAEAPPVEGAGGVASGAEAEYEARARAETRLRRDNAGRVSLAQLAGALRECQGGAVAARFEALGRFREGERDSAAPSEWASGFARALRIMGWPGGRLSEGEGVAFSKWREIMGELAALELVTPRMTRPEALGRLRELAAATLVQAPSGGLTVQVMGVLDGAGLSFDRLWLVGFEDRAFPRPAAPNPLLPVAWQAGLGMPRASASAELEFAKRLWRRLLASAPELAVSYAKQGEREETLQPSPFLFDYASGGRGSVWLASEHGKPAVEGGEPGGGEPWYRVLAGPREGLLTARERERAPRAELTWGGTGLIKDQSECPFRALAARRLGVEALAEAQSAPTAADLGWLVHRALGAAWAELGDSRTLRRRADGAVGEVARRAAMAALEQRRGLVPESMGAVALDW
ncbi:MAG: hypothetical protein ACE5EF_12120, partial [Dehalococcoidia bacterium]